MRHPPIKTAQLREPKHAFLFSIQSTASPDLLPLDLLSGNIDLSLDNLPGGSSDRVTLLHAVLKVEDVLDVICEVLGELLPLVHREVGDLDLVLLGERDGSAGDVVGLTEGDLGV